MPPKPTDQDILDCLYSSLQPFMTPDLQNILKRIRDHFFHRRFLDIFSNPLHLAPYTAAYVPTRALCYRNIYINCTQVKDLMRKHGKVVCIGAGAGSELLAFLVAYKQLQLENKQCSDEMMRFHENQPLEIQIQDLSPDWKPILESIYSTSCDCFNLSRERIHLTISHGDIRECSEDMKSTMNEADLITFMFVLNEIIQDKIQGMNVVRSLAENMKSGAFLLIVDSAGSFSNLLVNGKQYAVWMLFDAMKTKFERVHAEDATWYRPSKSLNWPVDAVQVQSMRYFLRLYRKI